MKETNPTSYAITTTSRSGGVTATHRRIGIASAFLLVVGSGWIATVVAPTFRGQENAKDTPATQMGNVGLLGFLNVFGNKKPDTAKIKPSPSPSSAPDQPTTEMSFIDAPIGLAVQMLFTVGQYSSDYAPNLIGTVTVSNIGNPLPLWETIGRVNGASAPPGVQVVRYWDSFRILRRDVNALNGGAGPYGAAAIPTEAIAPVPMGNGKVMQRMAGYVAMQWRKSQPMAYMALLETRVPGEVPHYRMVHVGEAVVRRNSQDIARESNPAANVDVAPAVESITETHLVLHGGGDKRLVVPLSRQGVPDTFGISAGEITTDSDGPRIPAGPGMFPPSAMPQQRGMFSRDRQN